MATALRTIAAAIGLAAVAYGLWQIYQPAAWIVCGVVLIVAALFVDDGS